MTATIVRVAALAAALSWFAHAHAEILLEDDRGQIIRLGQPAQRIVTLAPHLAELVFEAGAGERILGTVEWSNNPDAARRIPRVGDGFRVDAERIVGFDPDIVLAWGTGTPQNSIEQLERLGLTVAVLTPSTLEDIPRHLEWIGVLAGEEARAEDKAADFRTRLAGLRDSFAGRDRLKVFYQINDPLLFTIGGRHTIAEVISVCGGENIYSDLGPGAHAITRESVLARNPDVILVGSHTEELYDAADWRRWEGMSAVQAGSVFVVDADTIARAAPRILDGVEQVCTMLERARKNTSRKR